ncbi:MAG: AGE family epimerase/isomerase, partial [Maribacter sp.]|nr:AGE family epimerase/isomerase [Maribacter sp.]
EKRLTTPDGGLFHNYKNERSTINGYLEDYASVIDAYLALYEVTFDETWLERAKSLAQYCEKNFYDPKSGLFFFTSQKDDYVIRRTLETMDNVIPSSNSIMAKDLFKLSKFFPEDGFEDRSLQMLKSLQANILENVQSHANWLQLTLYFDQPFYEVAMVGESFKKKAQDLKGRYLPNAIFAGAANQNSSLSILQDRYSKGETWIYVCQHGSCKLPVSEPSEVLKQLRYP